MEYNDLAKRIEKLLNAGGRKLLFYHNDPDGICSAALILRFFPGFRAIPREGPDIESGFVSGIVRERPELVVFLDLPVDQEWKRIRELERGIPDVNILVIDHHIPERDMNSEKTLHINPMFERDVYLPASCIVYNILRGMGKAPPVWVAAIGTVGDYGFREGRRILGECKREHPSLNLGRAVDLISSAISLKGRKGVERCLEILLRAESPKEFMDSAELARWDRVVKKEFRLALKGFESRKEVLPGLIMYELKGRLNLNSPLSTLLSERYPYKTIVVRRFQKGTWNISVRNQSGKVNVGALTKKASRGIGSGGGHKRAAGATVKDWEKFRERFLEGIGKG